ncbi:Uncharacterised protein [uncultured archaeon]|nr:Uncharacterised protein [uncultured archaeon]
MPNRTILNKYGLFVSHVHKVLKKREHTLEDAELINKARLIATLSSNHSWRVHRFIHNKDVLDKDAINKEVVSAFTNGWKEIGENDIKEVVNSKIDPRSLSSVLQYTLDKEGRKRYGELLPKLKEEFVDGMEPIENRDQ